MWRFAAAEPFTMRAARREFERRRFDAAAVRRRRFGAAAADLRRRRAAVVRPPARPQRWNRACMAGVELPKATKPPGGMIAPKFPPP